MNCWTTSTCPSWAYMYVRYLLWCGNRTMCVLFSLSSTQFVYIRCQCAGAVDGRLGSRLRSYHPVTPRTLRLGPFVHRLLVPPIISRGAPRQATWETCVSEGRNWARNGWSIWPAIPIST
jgi:hypothetical protein